MTYAEKLKHPKWQEKRLRVLEAAGFQCSKCEDADSPLHVHHSYYERGMDPWGYADETLHCLCEKCHAEATERMAELWRQIARVGIHDVDTLIGYARGVATLTVGEEDGGERVENETVARGVADFFRIPTDAVMAAAAKTGRVREEDMHALRLSRREAIGKANVR